MDALNAAPTPHVPSSRAAATPPHAVPWLSRLTFGPPSAVPWGCEEVSVGERRGGGVWGRERRDTGGGRGRGECGRGRGETQGEGEEEESVGEGEERHRGRGRIRSIVEMWWDDDEKCYGEWERRRRRMENVTRMEGDEEDGEHHRKWETVRL